MVKTTIAVFMLLISTAVVAQTKVVVIPMAGDDVKVEPFAPVALPSPPDSAYMINDITPGENTVTDKITGLEWQREDDNVRRLWEEAWNYCAGLSLDGKNDWRLPSILELRSIVNHGFYNPPINPAVFLNTDTYYYWSSTSNASFGGVAWTVVFSDGNTGGWDKEVDGSLPVRCIRSGLQKGPVLRDNKNGTVSDLATGLIWQQVDDGTPRAWAAAQSYCDGLDLGDKKDWRLPSVKELESILDYRKTNPSIDDALFPSTNPSRYWSATHSTRILDAAWSVDFSQSFVGHHFRSSTFYVRCVR